MMQRPLWGRQGRSRTTTLAADPATGRVRITVRVKVALTTAVRCRIGGDQPRSGTRVVDPAHVAAPSGVVGGDGGLMLVA